MWRDTNAFKKNIKQQFKHYIYITYIYTRPSVLEVYFIVLDHCRTVNNPACKLSLFDHKQVMFSVGFSHENKVQFNQLINI